MILIVPSRGRPQNIVELRDTIQATTNGDVRFVVAVDDDDPTLDGYQEIEGIELVVGPSKRLCPWLNELAPKMAEQDSIIGFCGDDHRFRTVGWPTRMAEAIGDKGIAYGNDLFQRENLPTAVFMSSNIIRALGYMVPPDFIHLWADNAWLELGRGAGCVTYLDDVIVEHMHPHAGKGEWDDGYSNANLGDTPDHDRQAWEHYAATGLADDIEKIKAIRV